MQYMNRYLHFSNGNAPKGACALLCVSLGICPFLSAINSDIPVAYVQAYELAKQLYEVTGNLQTVEGVKAAPRSSAHR